jgi:intracellular sulfur oxidation DsrE/DsrF family protein
MIKEISEEAIKVVAHIMGPASAAAKTIADADRRRALGHQVKFYQDGNTLIVVQIKQEQSC